MPSAPTLPSSTPSNTPLPFTIRRARLSDLPSIARTCSLAFWHDILFGTLIHPHRHTYPRDNDIYWLRRLQVDFWDWGHVILVAVTSAPAPYPEASVRELPDDDETVSLLPAKSVGKERVIGTAHFSRSSPYPASHLLSNYAAGYALHSYSPLRLIKPLMRLYDALLTHLHLRVNRAADSQHEGILEASYPFLAHVWTLQNHRLPTWNLDCLAVRPDFQRSGVGRALVQWGLEQAEKEGICASVISGLGKERFYGRCGFDVGPVGWSGEGSGNPLAGVPGGLTFVRECRDVREGRARRLDPRRKGVCYGGEELEFV